jgi:hypothetical protein
MVLGREVVGIEASYDDKPAALLVLMSVLLAQSQLVSEKRGSSL